MPPRKYSRHSFTSAITTSGEQLLSDPEPFKFEDLEDNRTVIVSGGDTLFTLAYQYFQGLPDPALLWWIIADFQPTPIHDPTIELAPGEVIVIPSLQTVLKRVFSETDRRVEAF